MDVFTVIVIYIMRKEIGMYLDRLPCSLLGMFVADEGIEREYTEEEKDGKDALIVTIISLCVTIYFRLHLLMRNGEAGRGRGKTREDIAVSPHLDEVDRLLQKEYNMRRDDIFSSSRSVFFIGNVALFSINKSNIRKQGNSSFWGTSVTKEEEEKKKALKRIYYEASKKNLKNRQTDCVICMEVVDKDEECMFVCGHKMHKDCFKGFIKTQNGITRKGEFICPYCFTRTVRILDSTHVDEVQLALALALTDVVCCC